MNYNDKRKQYDVQVTKRFDKDHCEVSTATIPSPRQPSILKQILKRLDKIDDVLERSNLHLKKIDSVLERNNLRLNKIDDVLERHTLILERNNLH